MAQAGETSVQQLDIIASNNKAGRNNCVSQVTTVRNVVKVRQQTELEYDIFQGCITSQDTDYFHL